MSRANVPHVISDDSALGGQLVSGSLKINLNDNAYLIRTHSSVGNRRTFTISVWAKRSSLSGSAMFGAWISNSDRATLRFNTDFVEFQSTGESVKTTGKFRDTNGWYHIVAAIDTTQGTQSNRGKIYVNGVEQPLQTNNLTQNVQTSVNYNSVHTFGTRWISGPNGNFDGYLAEFYLIDGQQLEPTAFGYTESQTGIWRPKKYTGTFGTNGVHLPVNGFSHLGKDMSGNGNDFTAAISETVPIDRATGAFPIMNTNSGATIPRPGFRPDPFASNLVLAATFSDPIDTLDVEDEIRGSGSSKGLFVTGATKQTAIRNFYGRAGSLFFNGSGDKVTVNSSSDFAFGTGDFTIELWFYKSTSNVNEYLFDFENQLSVFIMAGNVIYYFAQIGGSNTGNVAFGTVGLYQWNHVAIVRRSGEIYCYLNGKQKLKQNEPRNWSSAQALTIGQYSGGGSYSFEGYMQDFRIYKGVAKYTEEFLCGAVDSSITEHSPSGISVPRKLEPSTGGSTGFNMEGASVFFSSNSDLTLSGDFTIEFWIYLESIQTDNGVNPSVITFPGEASQGIIGQVYINASNKFFGLYNSNSGDVCRTAYKSATVGRWQYVTITRSSNSVRIFIDGLLKNTATDSTTYGNQLGIMRLGGYSRSNGMVDGHISNLRIIKGTALYTSNFTPPTEPLTNVSGTSLLCFQSPTDVEDVTVNSNSSTVNNQNWFKTGSYTNTEAASVRAVLDGDGYTFWGNGNTEATFTFPGSGIPFTKLEISGSNYNGHYVKVNGVTFTNWGTTFTNPPFHNVTSVGSPLTSITVKGSAGTTSTMSAIRINDNTIIAPDFANDPYSSDSASASNFSPFDTDTNLQGPSQYATLNQNAQTGVTLTNENLTNTGGNDIPSNMGVKTGKFYAEVIIDTANSGSNLKHLGVCATGTKAFRARSDNGHIINELDTVTIRSDNNGPYTHTGRGGITSWTSVIDDTDVGFTLGDTVGIQLDMDNKFVKFYINGVLRTHYTFVLASTFDKMYFYGRNNGSGKTTWNFGQKPYEFTPPPGFLPLATHNLESASILKPQRFFDTVLYTGTGSANHHITGLDFKPDLVWIKARTQSYTHLWYDSVRGAGKQIYSESTAQEFYNINNLYSFNENGFSLARSSNDDVTNDSGESFVAWCWKGGSPETPTNGSAHFDANGDYLSLASTSDFDFGTGDFTLELYYRCDGYGNTPYMLEFRASGGSEAGSIVCYVQSSGEAVFWYNGSNRVISNSVITLSKWTHIAFVRHSGTTKMYIDGVAQSQTYTDTNDYGDGGRPLFIGVRRNGGSSLDNQSWDGELSNVRIVKGTAVYTSNFTPSTTPLTNISNTKLLCCQSTTSATTAAVTPGTITANGGVTPSISNPFDAYSVDGVGYATASAAGITDGSIPLTGASINKTSKFSCVSYQGNSTDGATVGHGLGVAPSFVVIKSRNLGTVGSAGAHWIVSHQYLTGGLNGGNSAQRIFFSLTNGESGNAHGAISAASSTTVTFKDGSGNSDDAHLNNSSGAYIMYSWADVPGYSRFGSYEGNGNSNGPYIDCGFRPALVIAKRIDSTDNWVMKDSKRNSYNSVFSNLNTNTNNSEFGSFDDVNSFDFYSNGFKIKGTNGAVNANGGRFVFMAWAEQPEVTPFGSQSNGR